MRREGIRYHIRTTNTGKYCFMCANNDHIDRGSTVPREFPADCVPIARFTKKPLFICAHSQECHMCKHRDKPHHKSYKKAKGHHKEEGKSFRDTIAAR